MSMFQLFIDDDRYAVTTLIFLSAGDDGLARDLAEQALRESPHHAGVELFRGERRIFGLGSLRQPSAAARRGQGARP